MLDLVIAARQFDIHQDRRIEVARQQYNLHTVKEMEAAIAISTGAITALLALVLIVKNQQSGSHFFLGGLVASLSLYTFSNYFALHALTQSELQLWTNIVMFSAVFAGPMFFFFVWVFPSSKFIVSRYAQLFILCWMAVNCILALRGMLFSHVELVGSNLSLTPSPFIIPFALLQGGMVILGVGTLIRKYIKSSGLLRQQLKIMAVGISVSFSLMLLTTVLLPIAFGSTELVAFSPLFIALGVTAVVIAVVRHRLLDIRPSLARTVAFVLLAAVFSVLISVAWIIISSYLFHVSIDIRQMLAIIFLTLVSSFSFQPLLRRLRKVTDNLFFSDFYNPEEILYDLTIVLASYIELNALISNVLKLLAEKMRLQKTALLLVDNGVVIKTYMSGLVDIPNIPDEISSALFKTHTPLIVEEMSHGIFRNWMTSSGYGMTVSLQTEKGVIIGYLLLGDKRSGNRFYTMDVNILKIFAPEAVIAIQNARSFEEIKAFNITLKEEVERATGKLRKANRRLRELDELKDEFVSLASHELRTPMVSIRNYIWLVLNNKAGEINPKMREYLNRAYDSASRLSRLVNGMLNISRIESGRIILTVTHADMNQVIKESFNELHARADKVGIRLIQHQKVINEETGREVKLPSVLVDVDKIKEVIVNLVGNSLKFTPKGGHIDVTVSVVDKDTIKIAVTDTGVGLTEEQIPQLFKKFGMIRESYVKTSMASGSGLGLYVSKAIVELHGGKIWVTSPGKDQGATFFFTVPVYSTQLQKAFADKTGDHTDAGIIPSALTEY